jgi:chromosome segregation ATPase
MVKDKEVLQKKWKAVEVKKNRIKAKRSKIEEMGKKPLVHMTAIKKRIRDLKRLISRPNVPEEIKAQKQNDLEKLESKLGEVAAAKAFHLKYKQAIFIEKRKSLRNVEKHEKAIRKLHKKHSDFKDFESKMAEEQKMLEEAKKNLDYIQYFPKTEKYVPLYKDSTPERIAKIAEMWTKVEQRKKEIESGEAEDWYVALFPNNSMDNADLHPSVDDEEAYEDSDQEVAAEENSHKAHEDDDFFL